MSPPVEATGALVVVSEVEAAVHAGAELVLSCNQSNVDWASDLSVEFVVILDDLTSFDVVNASRVHFVCEPSPRR